MKEYKNSTLIRKELVSEACYEQFFKLLSKTNPEFNQFRASLKEKLKGYYSVGNPILLRPGEKTEKRWFINEGMVIAFYKDHKGDDSLCMIFKAGEVIGIPENKAAAEVAGLYFMACTGTHLLEIQAEDLKLIGQADILAGVLYSKIVERDKILRYSGKERIKQFYKTFPELKWPNQKVFLTQRLIASYLLITEHYLSKNIRNIKLE